MIYSMRIKPSKFALQITLSLIISVVIFNYIICYNSKKDDVFSESSQTDNLISYSRNSYESMKQLGTKTEVFSDFSEEYRCIKQPWGQFNDEVHPKAPIHLLPDGLDILNDSSNAARLLEKCSKFASKKIRVLMINSRVGSYLQRSALRQTYFPFMESIHSSDSKWIYFFATNRPSKRNDLLKIKEENRHYGDVIIFNTSEGYQLTPLKILSSMKFAFCYCSNMEYFLKADDDTYLRVQKIEYTLLNLQAKLDETFPTMKNEETGHVPLNTAGKCNTQKTPRQGKHKVAFDVISSERMPFKYCWGQLSIWAKPIVENLISNCAQHCIGFYKGEAGISNFSRPCLWRPEDMYLGSCMHASYREKAVIQSLKQNAIILADPTKPKLKNRDFLIIGDRNSPKKMNDVHQFYLRLTNKHVSANHSSNIAKTVVS